MIELGRIRLGKSVYTHYYDVRDPKTGRFANSGNASFNFEKTREISRTKGGSVYQVVKHSEMNPVSVRLGKTISELMYRSRSPKFKIGAAALLLALGTVLAGALTGKKTQEVSPNTAEPDPAVVVEDTLSQEQTVIPDNTYVVKKIDNIWNISKDRLVQAGVNNPKNSEINNLKNETVRINPEAKNNGDLIYEGDVLQLPPID